MGVEDKLQELLAERAGGSAVSMRELNQKTRAVIDRVAKEGATLTVTDRGTPVAEIRPVGRKTGVDRLEEIGLVAQRGKLFEDGWRPAPSGAALDAWLEDERGGERLKRVMADLRAMEASHIDKGDNDD